MNKYTKPLTPKQIAGLGDEDLDFSELPELDKTFWDKAELVEPDRTDQVTLRVKRSVLSHFKTVGRGYQTRMNQVLESYVRSQDTQAKLTTKKAKTEFLNKGMPHAARRRP